MKNDLIPNMIPVSPSESFSFRCQMCGACCRHVKEGVLLESLDAFRAARYLRDHGGTVESVDELVDRYAIPVALHQSGYSVYMLKTVGPEDACVFLQDNRCAIHPAKPRACRTYPLEAAPNEKGALEQCLSVQYPHHFKGPKVSVKRWLTKTISREDREFIEQDLALAGQFAALLRDIPEAAKTQAVFLFLYYRYSTFDLNQPFMPQFETNNRQLMETLRKNGLQTR